MKMGRLLDSGLEIGVMSPIRAKGIVVSYRTYDGMKG